MNNIQSHNIKGIKFETYTSKKSGELIRVIFYDENDVEVYSHFLIMESKSLFAILQSENFLKILFKEEREFYQVIKRISYQVESIVNFLNKNNKIYLKEVKNITIDCSNKYPSLKSITFA